MGERDYLVATTKPWNLIEYERYSAHLPGHWSLVTTPHSLAAVAQRVQPRYIFFPHWSWLVPAAIYDTFEAIGFHMTDLPFGRGGSPLQNLIARGIETTQVSALRIIEALDAGPIYMKQPLKLEGSAEMIFGALAHRVGEMIGQFVAASQAGRPLTATAQSEVSVEQFQRRVPAQSEIGAHCMQSLPQLYDHIRMLDAPGYPRAFFRTEGYTFQFSQARLDDNQNSLSACVEISKHEDSVDE